MISVVAEKYIQIPSEGLRTKILKDVSFYLVGYVSLACVMLKKSRNDTSHKESEIS